MNLALSTLIVILILSPGFVYSIGYHSSKLSVRKKDRVLLNELIKSIVPAILIQALGVWSVNHLTIFTVNFELLGSLLISDLSQAEAKLAFQQIERALTPLLTYQMIILTGAYGLGNLVRFGIRKSKLDRRFRVFRFPNKWYYILSGECLDFPHVKDSYYNISYTAVDVLCKVNNLSYIYTGELFDFYVDPDGELNSLHLRYANRQLLTETSVSPLDPYAIPGKYTIIPGSNIINLNIRYISLEEVTTTTSQS